jgi:hypothetical protein
MSVVPYEKLEMEFVLAMELAKKQAQQIDSLTSQLDRAIRLCEAAQRRENELHKIIESLKPHDTPGTCRD